MAAARQCDRCKTFYTENRKNPKLNYVARGVGIIKGGCNFQCPTPFDLCDSCMNDFLTFIYDYEAPVEPTEPEDPNEPETPPTTEPDSEEPEEGGDENEGIETTAKKARM